MAEFLELVESINAEAATADKLFGGEGVRITPRNNCLLYTSPSPRDA